MKKFLRYFLPIIAFFIIGLILANYVVMPIIVRTGKDTRVPNVCNLSLNEAIDELKRCRLQGVVVERRFDPIIEEGKIIIQEPLPDVNVKRGRIINLSVSLGPQTVKIPYLQGVNIQKGRMILEKLGLNIESIDSIYSDSIPGGEIVRTIPEAETEVKKGEQVTIFVSKGIILNMPNLMGQDINQARQIIKKLGLAIGEVKEVEASGKKGNIILQNPEPEKIVVPGDTVSLMIIK